MDRKQIAAKVSKAKKAAKKRKFKQSVDLIITLKDINLKNPEEQVDFFIQLHNPLGKKIKVCALVGPELKLKAEKMFDTVIGENEFDKLRNNKKAMKKLVKEHNYFVAQSNLMSRIAQYFGKILGPRGKMPNPKAGCVVDLKTDLNTLYKKLQRTVRVVAKTQPQIQCFVGVEDLEDEKIADNIHTIYESLIHQLPKGEQNINKVYVKLTMGPAVEVM